MDAETLNRLRDEFQFALDEMARRLQELRRHNPQVDESAFREAKAAYERSRLRWLDAHSALSEASGATDQQAR